MFTNGKVEESVFIFTPEGVKTYGFKERRQSKIFLKDSGPCFVVEHWNNGCRFVNCKWKIESDASGLHPIVVTSPQGEKRFRQLNPELFAQIATFGSWSGYDRHVFEKTLKQIFNINKEGGPGSRVRVRELIMAQGINVCDNCGFATCRC